MSFFKKLASLFTSKKREDDEWAKYYAHIPPAKPDHLLPLDPNDPWKT